MSKQSLLGVAFFGIYLLLSSIMLASAVEGRYCNCSRPAVVEQQRVAPLLPWAPWNWLRPWWTLRRIPAPKCN
jgi:hypothetical protein